MIDWLMMFIVNFVIVFLKAYQTQVIIHGGYITAFFVSMAMGVALLINTMLVIHHGWFALTPLTLGGSCGVVYAMYIYRKQRDNKDD